MSCEPYKFPVVRIVDIDGTILPKKEIYNYLLLTNFSLPGAVEVLDRWFEEGNFIVLWTARPEQYREQTIIQLEKANISYHQLLMDKPYSDEIHIYDDKVILSHKVVPNVGIGGLREEEKR